MMTNTQIPEDTHVFLCLFYLFLMFTIWLVFPFFVLSFILSFFLACLLAFICFFYLVFYAERKIYCLVVFMNRKRYFYDKRALPWLFLFEKNGDEQKVRIITKWWCYYYFPTSTLYTPHVIWVWTPLHKESFLTTLFSNYYKAHEWTKNLYKFYFHWFSIYIIKFRLK